MLSLSFSQRAWAAFAVLAILNLLTALVASMGGGSGATWGAAVFGALVALGGGGWWINRASSALDKVSNALKRIEQGDFKAQIRVDASDEFSSMMLSAQSLAGNLAKLMGDVMAASLKIADQSDHLDRAAEALAAQTGQQSAQAAQVSAATEQMSMSVSEISKVTGQTAESAMEAKTVVREGERNMQASIASTRRIVEVVGEARATLDDLNQAVERIGNLTSVIKEIADQTNLLALNAAIEAARAGESGRGFAVVADEVRKLAERTAQSTQDINNNVANIQLVTQATLMTMSDAAAEVENGTAAIEATSENLQAVAQAADRTVGMTGQIVDTLRQQSTNAEDVARTIERMAGTIDANNREAQDVAKAADRLAQTVTTLKAMVAKFEKV
ncbi:methyl-accepting chemotaxis protein [Chitinimonas sp.]|uniref:methyl-accepting chemotaxis protein n=1 Tax=Chitinimonas sp. TaxID=1934313 RepID=UPI0035AE2B16